MSNTVLPLIKDISGSHPQTENFISMFSVHHPHNLMKEYSLRIPIFKNPNDITQGQDIIMIKLSSRRNFVINQNKDLHNKQYEQNGDNSTSNRITKNAIRSLVDYHNGYIKEYRITEGKFFNENTKQDEPTFTLEHVFVDRDGRVKITPIVDKNKVQITDTIKKDVLAGMTEAELRDILAKMQVRNPDIVEGVIVEKERLEKTEQPVKKRGRKKQI